MSSGELPFWFDVTVMTVNCGFGAAVARSRNVPVIGTIFIGLVVGLGGGMVRDVLLNTVPVAIANWQVIPLGVLAGIVAALLFSSILRNANVLALLQGLTLGFLVTIGAQRALDFDVPIVSAMFLGIITASAGAIMADTMTGYRAAVVKQAHWIITALLAGSVVFVVLSVYVNFWVAVAAGVLAVAALRFLSQWRNWPSPRWPGEAMQTPDSP